MTLIYLILSIIFMLKSISCLEIIYALNAGGDAFIDSHGIRYRRDFQSDGVASDYGKMLDIKRVNVQDKPLYQTERYSTQTFGYTIPMPPDDGEYVLWLKFSEVWFNAPNLKVFDIALNDVVVIKDLDIFANVGRGVAHDEIVPFQVRSKKLIINSKVLPFENEIRVDFIKTDRDNPKVNAIIIMKGKPDQVPRLPPYEPPKKENEFDEDTEEEAEAEEEEEKPDTELNSNNDEDKIDEKLNQKSRKKNIKATPKIIDPYESDETSYLLPILVSIGAFVPLLYCICKL